MKTTAKITVCLSAAIAALVSGCEAYVSPAGVAVTAPAVVVAPDAYVWDGVEYVGYYNGQYMYLNGGGAWVVCDPVILARFHGWERYHPDWRRTAVRYDRAHPPSAHGVHREPVRREER